MSLAESVSIMEQEQTTVAHRDLRGFMETLAAQGQLMKVCDEVMPEPGVRGYLRAASQMENDGPAIIFDNIKGYKGQKLLINTHGSWANTALLFGMPKKTVLIDQFHDLSNKWDRYPGEVKWVENAACQENVVDKNINLYQMLPLVRINPYDGGYFLSKASVISKDITDPDNFNAQNIGMYRLQVQGPDTIGFSAFYAGVLIAPFSIGYVAGALSTPAILRALGLRATALGLLVAAAGLSTLAVGVNSFGVLHLLTFTPGVFAIGVGQGIVLPTLVRAVIQGAPADYAGAASGVVNSTLQISASLGAATIGSVFFAIIERRAGDPATVAMAFTTALLCLAPLLLCAAFLAWGLGSVQGHQHGSA